MGLGRLGQFTGPASEPWRKQRAVTRAQRVKRAGGLRASPKMLMVIIRLVGKPSEDFHPGGIRMRLLFGNDCTTTAWKRIRCGELQVGGRKPGPSTVVLRGPGRKWWCLG